MCLVVSVAYYDFYQLAECQEIGSQNRRNPSSLSKPALKGLKKLLVRALQALPSLRTPLKPGLPAMESFWRSLLVGSPVSAWRLWGSILALCL